MERIGKPQPGDTVFVSAAAGVCDLIYKRATETAHTRLAQNRARCTICREGSRNTVCVCVCVYTIGAVGLVVGQLCKHVYGCKRVIGSAGSDEKVTHTHTHTHTHTIDTYRQFLLVQRHGH